MKTQRVFKKVTFSIANGATCFERGQVLKPLCSTAIYLCMLARRQKLSLEELFIVKKIGFEVDILTEKRE